MEFSENYSTDLDTYDIPRTNQSTRIVPHSTQTQNTMLLRNA